MKKRTRKITKARIDQISNDISEGMCRATKDELIQVVLHFRDAYDNETFRRIAIQDEIRMAYHRCVLHEHTDFDLEGAVNGVPRE